MYSLTIVWVCLIIGGWTGTVGNICLIIGGWTGCVGNICLIIGGWTGTVGNICLIFGGFAMTLFWGCRNVVIWGFKNLWSVWLLNGRISGLRGLSTSVVGFSSWVSKISTRLESTGITLNSTIAIHLGHATFKIMLVPFMSGLLVCWSAIEENLDTRSLLRLFLCCWRQNGSERQCSMLKVTWL